MTYKKFKQLIKDKKDWTISEFGLWLNSHEHKQSFEVKSIGSSIILLKQDKVTYIANDRVMVNF